MNPSNFYLAIIMASATANAYSHSQETHRKFTQLAVQYLKQKDPNFACFDESKILAGASKEDDFPRMLFHFDPALKSFIEAPNHATVPVDGSCNSSSWGLRDSPACTTHIGSYARRLTNEFTWPKAVAQAADVGSSDNGWNDLGYVLHLLQDLTSPAHVRNDPHPPDTLAVRLLAIPDPDPIESVNRTPQMPTAELITDLLDVSDYFTQLRNWTQLNFFSKDTVFSSDFPLPTLGSDAGEYFLDAAGNKLAHKGLKYYESNIVPFDRRLAELDDVVLDEQFSRLSKEAIRYSASLISFYRNKTGAPVGNCAQAPFKAYLPAALSGRAAGWNACGPNNLFSTVAIQSDGSFLGSGCYSSIDYAPPGSPYLFGSSRGSAGLVKRFRSYPIAPTYAGILISHNVSTEAVLLSAGLGSGAGQNPGQNAVANDNITTFNVAERMTGWIKYTSNRQCKLVYPGNWDKDNARVEIGTNSNLTVKAGGLTVVSVPLSTILNGNPLDISFDEEWRRVLGSATLISAVAGYGRNSTNVNNISVSLPDIVTPGTAFTFQWQTSAQTTLYCTAR